MSLSTIHGSTWVRMRKSEGLRVGPRTFDMMCVSGWLVMGELTPGVSKTDCPSTRRLAGSGSPFDFIEGTDRDHGEDTCRPERLDKKLLYLVLK